MDATTSKENANGLQFKEPSHQLMMVRKDSANGTSQLAALSVLTHATSSLMTRDATLFQANNALGNQSMTSQLLQNQNHCSPLTSATQPLSTRKSLIRFGLLALTQKMPRLALPLKDATGLMVRN